MRDYGELTPHTIGITMKEMVRRVTRVIKEHQFAFEVSEKRDYNGELGDLVTDVDKTVQDIYLEMIRENFPKYGVLGEEDNLKLESDEDIPEIYFTVDPLDGTKAFIRGQSQGIGTMIALVYEDDIISAYVGDIMTEEVYGYRPESDKVHRISEFGGSTRLSLSDDSLENQYIDLRKDPRKYSDFAREVIDEFKGINIRGGSIGTNMARLWKGVAGAIILSPHHETPWDSTPIVGISEKLGLNFYKLKEDGIEKLDIPRIKEPVKRDFEMLVAPEEVEKLLS